MVLLASTPPRIVALWLDGIAKRLDILNNVFSGLVCHYCYLHLNAFFNFFFAPFALPVIVYR